MLEEIRKMSRDYNMFLFLVGYDPEVLGIPSFSKEMYSKMKRKNNYSSKEHDGEKTWGCYRYRGET